MNSLLQRFHAAIYDRTMDAVERAGLAELRRDLVGGLDGEVVEIGPGTGANLAHYGPGVQRVVAVEPSRPMAERLRPRAADAEPDVEVVVAPAERLPLPDGCADAVVSTLVLCSVRDVERVVAEARRVLRPGGRFLLLEHVAGQDRLLRLQRFVQPVYSPLAGGCRLTRNPLPALEAAGFDVSGVRRVELPTPSLVRPGLVGCATLT